MLSFYTNPLHLSVSPKHIKEIDTQKAMFNPSSSSSALAYSDLSMQHAGSFSSAPPTAPAEIPRGSGSIRDDGGLFSLPSFAVSAPPPLPYSSSVPSYRIHSNTSSHCVFPFRLQSSPPLSGNGGAAALSCPSPPACRFHGAAVSSPPSSSSDLLEFSSGNMRRVFSTGDLQMQGMKISPPQPPQPWPPFSGDNCGREAGEPFCQKVARYSAEERKDKIERYRAKRQLRNFHKKITYVCRKTLADSRPRVQGRFARNLETEAAMAAADLERDSYEYYPSSDITTTTSNCYDSQSHSVENDSTCMLPDDSGGWWRGAAVVANGQHQQKLGFDVDIIDDELWASLAEC